MNPKKHANKTIYVDLWFLWELNLLNYPPFISRLRGRSLPVDKDKIIYFNKYT